MYFLYMECFQNFRYFSQLLTKSCTKFKRELSNCLNKCSYSIKYDIKDIPITGMFCFDCSFSLIRKIIKCNVHSINDTFIRL